MILVLTVTGWGVDLSYIIYIYFWVFWLDQAKGNIKKNNQAPNPTQQQPTMNWIFISKEQLHCLCDGGWRDEPRVKIHPFWKIVEDFLKRVFQGIPTIWPTFQDTEMKIPPCFPFIVNILWKSSTIKNYLNLRVMKPMVSGRPLRASTGTG